MPTPSLFLVFFFNDPATTEIYTLSLHDALPICLAFCERRQLSNKTLPSYRCPRRRDSESHIETATPLAVRGRHSRRESPRFPGPWPTGRLSDVVSAARDCAA